tara:strand:- start:25 stop:735 length:711 start_codon:yes stop_codon:yes gene_type:complete
MSSFMSDPEITENVIDDDDGGEEYTLKNRIDTDKVFKKRPVQGKVTTETPDVIMPVVEEVKEPEAKEVIEEQVIEEESGGANFVYEEQVETVKPQKKPKRKMTEKQLEALKRGREKSLATRQAKKNVKKSINIAPEQPRQLGPSMEQPEQLQYRPQTPIQPRPQTPIQPQYVKKDELKNAMIEAISTYDGIRKTRKEEKKKAEKTATEAQKLTAVIQKALNPSQDEFWADCFNVTH